MNDLLRDIGYAFRSLRRDLGFAIAALFTLALGIGATATVFSVMNTVLLRPLPFADQDRLAVVWAAQWKRNYEAIEGSYLDYRDWREQNKVFEDMAALGSTTTGMSLTGRGEPLQVEAGTITSNLFSVLGVEPMLGRGFLPEEDVLGSRPVAVLSHALWQNVFGRDPGLLGRQLWLNGQSYTVVGVMAPDFNYPRGADLWVPLVPALGREAVELRLYRALKAVGRMKPGVTLESANTEVRQIAGRLEKQYPFSNSGFSATVKSLPGEVFGYIRPALLLLSSGVLLLLLIAVANVANLLLARTLGRQSELSVRMALGADRGRLLRQLLTEGFVLCAIAGTAGLLLAHAGIRTIALLAPRHLPRIGEVQPDAATLLITMGVSLVTVLGFGTILALQTGRGNLHDPLKAGSKRSAGSAKNTRLRKLLVASEVAFAMVLLVGAGLMVRSVRELQRVNPGFDKHNVLTMRVRLPEQSYPEVERRRIFFEQLLERVEALPGVAAAATSLARPLDEAICCDMPFAVDWQNRDEVFSNPYANLQAVSPHYFETMRIPLLKGRAFTPQDKAGAPLVAIVSRNLADTYWPDQNPIGKKVRRVYSEDQTPWMTVVGVVEDVRYREWDRARPDVYVPAPQNPYAEFITYQDLLVRTTSSDPEAIAGAVRSAVYALDPNQPVAAVMTLESLVERALAGPRFTLFLISLLSVLALVLAAVGVYGVLSYTVNQRAREIGIRMALGATKREVVRLVLAQGMRLTLAGLGVGLLGALILTRFMASLMYQVSVLDPLTFATALVLLATIGFLATFVPAVRATRADPLQVIRAD
jgi:putative ABC transport system permease protein